MKASIRWFKPVLITVLVKTLKKYFFLPTLWESTTVRIYLRDPGNQAYAYMRPGGPVSWADATPTVLLMECVGPSHL